MTPKRPAIPKLIKHAKENAEFTCDPEGNVYVSLSIGERRETLPLRSRPFADFLIASFFAAEGSPPRESDTKTVVRTLEAVARSTAPRRQVYRRVGRHEGRIYLDLCDNLSRCVEIDADGYRVIEDAPLLFRHSRSTGALPQPVEGGTIEELRRFCNVDDRDFAAVVGFTVSSLRPEPPYFGLGISGEQGSGKSFTTATIKRLIDPSTAVMRATPRSEHDLLISARWEHVLAFDNASGISNEMSDVFCRLSTGGTFGKRQLYSDDEEVLLHAGRPFIINGIADLVSRQDLASRMLFVTARALPDNQRLSEEELRGAFAEAHPRILGALCTAVSHALRTGVPSGVERTGRMVDATHFAQAAEGALWPTPKITEVFAGNRAHAIDRLIDEDPVAAAIRRVMESTDEISATASNLIGMLQSVSEPLERLATDWPRSANQLSARLRRLASALRSIGINIHFDRVGRERTRLILITKCDLQASPGPVAAPEVSEPMEVAEPEAPKVSEPEMTEPKMLEVPEPDPREV